MEGKKVLFSTLCTTPVDHFILTLRMTDTWRDRHGQLSSVTFASFLSSSYGTHGKTWLLFLFIYLSFYFCSPIFLGGGCCLSCVARNRNNFPFFFLSCRCHSSLSTPCCPFAIFYLLFDAIVGRLPWMMDYSDVQSNVPTLNMMDV